MEGKGIGGKGEGGPRWGQVAGRRGGECKEGVQEAEGGMGEESVLTSHNASLMSSHRELTYCYSGT